MYGAATRVLHINEVARVPSTLVETARSQGKNWRLHRIPAATPPWGPAIRARARDYAGSLALRRGADIVHVHYGVNGYYAWGMDAPTVLHLHGSDIRTDIHRHPHSALLRAALRRADLVLFATPDLADLVTPYRPDAHYLPNPIPPRFLTPTATRRQRRLVVAARWDDSKGGMDLVRAAGRLVEAGVEVHGFDWGTYATQAADLGVICHPLMEIDTLQVFLASARLVIGQQAVPALSMLDLQALAQGTPVLSPFTAPGITTTSLDSLVAEALAAWSLTDRELAAAGETGNAWVRAHHVPEATVAALEEHYRALV
ncbi:glycosyltransferase family 4 protein [Nanchangia anserum]|uniref:Glycosyltransferase family 4 protein n=1 Tax=Nanchangia anserum TaxID=2692125 RepID=A0A8I0GEN2_9ACTO|nr:glycosyltransferase [Nanchangia anserum]MBD3690108.1 glycosyltransferase family 4 protein [Nanchangia anserum]QOX82106.1 glycosyltransferase family 4 protein [Nanchangia anserum]